MASIFAFLESFWCCFAGIKRSFKSTLKRIEVQVIFQVTPNFARFCAVCSNYLSNPQNPFATLILLMGGDSTHPKTTPPTFKTQPMHVFAPRTKSTKKRDQTGSFWTQFCQTGFFLPPFGRPPSFPCCKELFPSLAHFSSCLGMKKTKRRSKQWEKDWCHLVCLIVIG